MKKQSNWTDDVKGNRCDFHGDFKEINCPKCKEMNPPTEEKGRKIIQKEKLFVDATPDGNYALRTLQAYRLDCNLQWADNTAGLKLTNPVLLMLNGLQEKRAKELDIAIKKLSK